ncbi:MAG: hypothetical protein ACO265_04650 [Polynucleobacter sp.]
MPSFFDIQNACLKQATAFVGEEFVYNGVTYRGVIAGVKTDRELEQGGFRHAHLLNIYVNKTEFPAFEMGDFIHARNQEFFIKGYTEDSISYTLELDDPNG